MRGTISQAGYGIALDDDTYVHSHSPRTAILTRGRTSNHLSKAVTVHTGEQSQLITLQDFFS